jgi:negative regulator of genetic competence, sporulation and motility
LEKLLPLGLENVLKMTVSFHFLNDRWMDSKDVWYTDVS